VIIISVKKSIEEVVEALLKEGVRPEAVKRSLINLGFDREQVEKVLTSVAVSPSTVEPEYRLINDELKRQKLSLEELRKEFTKIKDLVNTFINRIELLEKEISQAATSRLTTLEARFNALIDALIDYAPYLFEDSRLKRMPTLVKQE